jgi:hypothetical protein
MTGHVYDALFGTLAVADIFVRGDPPAACDRLVHDREYAAVGRLGDSVGCLALSDVVQELDDIALLISAIRADRLLVIE